MPPRAIEHQLTCPFEITSGSFLIGGRRFWSFPGITWIPWFISVTELVLFTNIAIEIKPKYGKPFLSLSWYRPNYKPDDFEQIETVCQVLEAEGKEIIIILGDTKCNDNSKEGENKMVNV